jgi:hypothetical protein
MVAAFELLNIIALLFSFCILNTVNFPCKAPVVEPTCEKRTQEFFVLWNFINLLAPEFSFKI